LPKKKQENQMKIFVSAGPEFRLDSRLIPGKADSDSPFFRVLNFLFFTLQTPRKGPTFTALTHIL